MLRTPAERSPIRTISDGRRAAISIDRYLQRVSLTASRTNEGSYVTRLYTNTAWHSAATCDPIAQPRRGLHP